MFNLEEAIELWNGENPEDSIPIFCELLRNNVYEAAYYLGINAAYEGDFLEAYKYSCIYNKHGFDDEEEIVGIIADGILKFIKSFTFNNAENNIHLIHLLRCLKHSNNLTVKHNAYEAIDLFFQRFESYLFNNNVDLSYLLEDLQQFSKNEHASAIICKYYSSKANDMISSFQSVEDYDEIMEICKLAKNQSLVSKLNLKMAQSYKNGLNGAVLNEQTALKYYDLVSGIEISYEYNEVLTSLINKLYVSKKYDEILTLVDKLKGMSLMEKVNKKNSIIFDRDIENYNKGNYSNAMNAAKLLYDGQAVTQNISKAVEIAKKVYEVTKSDESFSFLVDYYHYKSPDAEKEEYKSLLNEGIRNKNHLPYIAQDDYLEMLASYKKGNYEFIDLRTTNIKEYDENSIYFLWDYYKKEWITRFPENSAFKNSYYTIIAIKNHKYFERRKERFDTKNFIVSIKDALKILAGNWIIGFAPGHDDTRFNTNGVIDIVEACGLESRFSIDRNLVLKKYSTEAKKTSSNRSTSYTNDIESLILQDSYKIKEKNVIIFDDITTSGATLIACRVLLKDAGAKNVILISLAKTKEIPYEWR